MRGLAATTTSVPSSVYLAFVAGFVIIATCVDAEIMSRVRILLEIGVAWIITYYHFFLTTATYYCCCYYYYCCCYYGGGIRK